MIKFILFLVVLVGAGFLAMTMLGYEFHPEHFKYYAPNMEQGATAEIELNNGRKVEGEILNETDRSIKINMEGAVMEFSKTQVKSIKQNEANFVTQYMDTLKYQNKIHPIFKKKKKAYVAPGSQKKGGAIQGVLETVSGAGNLKTLEKAKGKIADIEKIASERANLVDELTASSEA